MPTIEVMEAARMITNIGISLVNERKLGSVSVRTHVCSDSLIKIFFVGNRTGLSPKQLEKLHNLMLNGDFESSAGSVILNGLSWPRYRIKRSRDTPENGDSWLIERK